MTGGRSDWTSPAPPTPVVDAEFSASGSDDPDAELEEVAEGQRPLPASRAHGQITMYREERAYRGPLPDPSMLEAYKRVDPRFPDAILEAFREQSAHRQEMERRLLAGSERRANRGQWLGTGLLLVGLGGGVWVTLVGQSVAGPAIVGASLAVGALSYVFGDYRPKEK